METQKPCSSLLPPVPTHASKKDIGLFAEHVRKFFRDKKIDDLRAMVAALGGNIRVDENVAPDSDIPESIIVRDKNDFDIFLSSLTTFKRDRFTIAHELGHLFLHYPMVLGQCPSEEKPKMRATRWVDENDKDLLRTEWEANWFAASFLMPEQAFHEQWKELGGSSNISFIAEAFGVTDAAARIRAKNLGLLND